MSTNTKKLYFAKDFKEAQENQKRAEGYFTRKTKRRKTVQIRLDEKWHQKIKDAAKDERVMLSFFLDRICEIFFKNY